MSFILVPIHLSLTIPLWDLDQEDPLEKEIATHSSILAGKIHLTEEPGSLQSMGSQRMGHELLTEHTRVHTRLLM